MARSASRLKLGYYPLSEGQAQLRAVDQMCAANKYGFPIRHRTRCKLNFGFQMGTWYEYMCPQANTETFMWDGCCAGPLGVST